MAIAHDNSSSSGATVTTPITTAHTTAGTNVAIVTYVLILSTGNTTTCSGVTYNGNAMTLLQGPITPTGNTSQQLYMFGMIVTAGNIGAHSTVVTLNNSTAAQVDIISESYTGVSQSGFPDASNNNTGLVTSTTITANVTNSANAVLVGAAEFGNGGNPAAGTGTFLRTLDSNTTMASLENSGPLTPLSAGTNGLTATVAGANFTAMVVASLLPSASAIVTNFLSLLGTGT